MSSTSSVENTGIFTTWLNSPMTAMAVPSEAMADSSGSAMAKIDPNTSSSTTPARSTPSPVPPNDWRSACSAIWPDTATCRVLLCAVRAAFTKSLDCWVDTFWPCTSKVTLMNAVCLSALI